MATFIKSTYIGDSQVELIHELNQAKIVTDLPVDNGGKGRTFSPTDLFSSALSSCILTIMSKTAERDEIDMKGTTLNIEKHMQDNPRKVSKFEGVVSFPEHINEEQRKKLLRCIKACPVHKSLDPSIEVNIHEA